MSTISPGKTYPLGATLTAQGVNFSVHSKNCSWMELLLFDDVNDAQPAKSIRLDPSLYRTFHYWHVHVDGLRAGQIYAFRAHGPFDPDNGLRFDAEKVLLDP